MDRVTVDDIDDLQGDDPEVNLAEMSTEDAVRHLMSYGTAELDARWLVAMAKGEITGGARAARTGAEARTA